MRHLLVVLALAGSIEAAEASVATNVRSDVEAANQAFALENFSEAQRLYQRVIDDPSAETQRAFAMLMVGRTAMALGEWSQAETTLRELLAAFPKSEFADNACIHLANFYATESPERNLPEAVALLRQLLRDHPTSEKATTAAFRLAELLTELGEWEAAIAQFQTLLTEPLEAEQRSEVRFALAEVYRNTKNPQHDLQKAAGLYQGLLESKHLLRAKLPRLYFGYALCLRDLERHKDAVEMFERLLREFPESIYASVTPGLLARCYEAQREQAAQSVVKALRDASAPPASAALLDSIVKASRERTAAQLSISADRQPTPGVFEGNVVVRNQQVTVTAQQAWFDRERLTLRTSGGSSLKRGDLHLSSVSMVYDLASEEVTLSDAVVIIRGDNRLFQGPQSRYSLRTDIVLPAVKP